MQVTSSMGGVVKAMESAMRSMNLEKVSKTASHDKKTRSLLKSGSQRLDWNNA